MSFLFDDGPPTYCDECAQALSQTTVLFLTMDVATCRQCRQICVGGYTTKVPDMSKPFGPSDLIKALQIEGHPCDEHLSESCTNESALYIAGRYVCEPCLKTHTFECRDDDMSIAATVWRAMQKPAGKSFGQQWAESDAAKYIARKMEKP